MRHDRQSVVLLEKSCRQRLSHLRAGHYTPSRAIPVLDDRAANDPADSPHVVPCHGCRVIHQEPVRSGDNGPRRSVPMLCKSLVAVGDVVPDRPDVIRSDGSGRAMQLAPNDPLVVYNAAYNLAMLGQSLTTQR